MSNVKSQPHFLHVTDRSVVVKQLFFSVQVHCDTLQDVVTYLVDATDGILIPLIIEGHYEKIVSMYI